jgi:hypothetical protein
MKGSPLLGCLSFISIGFIIYDQFFLYSFRFLFAAISATAVKATVFSSQDSLTDPD